MTALCDGVDTRLFFPDEHLSGEVLDRLRRVARTYCQPCPLRAACRAHGVREVGLWGGTLFRLRAKEIDLLLQKGEVA